MIAVCGIGRPSGWRKSAVTANQSASLRRSRLRSSAARMRSQGSSITVSATREATIRGRRRRARSSPHGSAAGPPREPGRARGKRSRRRASRRADSLTWFCHPLRVEQRQARCLAWGCVRGGPPLAAPRGCPSRLRGLRSSAAASLVLASLALTIWRAPQVSRRAELLGRGRRALLLRWRGTAASCTGSCSGRRAT